MSERKYGLFNRAPEDKTRCIKAIHGGGRWPSFHQCKRKRGHGPDGLYCKTHDPAEVKKRAEAITKKWNKRMEVESSPRVIYASTTELIAELKKRRPCERCAYKRSSFMCLTCYAGKKDNFKSTTGPDKGGR